MEAEIRRTPGLVCGSVSLATKQYYGVKLHTDGTVIVSSVQGERAAGGGILLNKPAVGEAAEVAFDGVMLFSADAAVAIGAPMTVQSDGQMMTAGGGDYVWGYCLLAAGAAGEYGTMLLQPQGVL